MYASLASHQVRPQNFQKEARSFTMAQPLSAQGIAEVLSPDKTLGNFFLKLGTSVQLESGFNANWNLAAEGANQSRGSHRSVIHSVHYP